MVNVIGFWDFGWNTPIKEMELWEFALKEFIVDNFYMTPVSGINNIYVTEVADIEAKIAEQRLLGQTIVFLSEMGATELKDFIHPTNVTYVLGKASFSPNMTYWQEGDGIVKIPTAANQGGFWPHQAISIVLYDRFLKLNS